MNIIIRNVTTVATAMAAAFLLSGCFPDKLTEKPARGGGAASFTSAPSTIGAQATITLADIARLIGERVPASFSAGGTGPNYCGIVCVGTQYSFSASRGNPTLSAPNPNTLRVLVPISFSGQGGFRGDGAKILGLDKKNFDGALNVVIDLSPDVDANWCPVLNARLSYSWTSNARVEIVSRVNVDVSGQVSGQIDPKLGEIQAAVNGLLNCNQIKPEIQKSFAVYSFAAKLPDGSNAYLNFKPREIGFSGFRVDSQDVKATAVVTADVEVSTKSAPTKTLPLPVLKRVPNDPPEMHITMPVRASYDTLTRQLKDALVGKTFEGAVPGGTAKVKVSDIEVYPSGKKLVVGLKAKAQLPSHWFDVSGEAYLFATPTVENKTTLRLKDVGFARKLDSQLWTVVTAILEKQIVREIQSAGVYDFGSDIGKAKKMLLAELNKPTTVPGGKLTMTDVDMGLNRVEVGSDELAVEGLFSAKTTLVLSP